MKCKSTSLFSLSTEVIKGVNLNFYRLLLYEGDMVDLPAKVPLHQCTQHGQQTGGAESHCSTRKLGPNCHHCDVVGRTKGLVNRPT